MRFSHTHALFSDGNGKVFDNLELATRGTKFAASIAPFKRTKNGRAASIALKAQHAGPVHWDAKQKSQTNFLLNWKYTGGTTIPLSDFLSTYRDAFTSIQRYAEHVQCQIPDDRTQVGYIIDNIECPDPDVKAALAAIKMDGHPPNGMQNDFESAVAMLLPVDPVGKKRKGKMQAAEILATETGPATIVLAGVSVKSDTGTSGVSLRYHTPAEYAKLGNDQRDELCECRTNQESKGTFKRTPAKGRNATKKQLRGTVASIIEDVSKKEAKKTTNLNKMKALLASLVVLNNGNSTTTNIATSSATANESLPLKKRVKFDADAAEETVVKLQNMLKMMSANGVRDGKKSGGR